MQSWNTHSNSPQSQYNRLRYLDYLMKSFILSKNKKNAVDQVDQSTKTLWASVRYHISYFRDIYA